MRTVIKVGGSLLTLPDLATRLKHLLATIPGRFQLIAGGGESADAVRKYDQIHQLSESAAHHLAILSLSVTTELLKQITNHQYDDDVCDVVAFCTSPVFDLPHTWQVTTDSIAAKYALATKADQLILLKSIEISEQLSWQEMANQGYVDDYFPIIAKELTRSGTVIQCLCLRAASALK